MCWCILKIIHKYYQVLYVNKSGASLVSIVTQIQNLVGFLTVLVRYLVLLIK